MLLSENTDFCSLLLTKIVALEEIKSEFMNLSTSSKNFNVVSHNLLIFHVFSQSHKICIYSTIHNFHILSTFGWLLHKMLAFPHKFSNDQIKFQCCLKKFPNQLTIIINIIKFSCFSQGPILIFRDPFSQGPILTGTHSREFLLPFTKFHIFPLKILVCFTSLLDVFSQSTSTYYYCSLSTTSITTGRQSRHYMWEA